jgi:hypothetical protein
VTKPRPPKNKPLSGAPEPVKPAAPSRPVNPRVSWLVASALVSAALVTVAAFLPAERLWGINHLAFVPPTARFAAIGLILLAFIPVAAKPLYRGGIRLFDAIGFPRRGAVAWILIVAGMVAATSTFWTFRSSTLLLGDGQLLVRSFEAAEEGYQKVIMRSAKAIANEEMIAPGTTLSYYGAIKAGSKWFKQPPLNSMRGFNCLLGGLLILLLGTVVTGNFARGELRLWLLVLALASASMELFFGYIENYTTPTLLLAVYVVLAFRALHGRGPAWLSIVPLGMACYAHVQSILFVPSFVYLMLWTIAPSRRPALLRYWTTTFTALAIIGVMVAPVMVKMRKFYVPLGFSNEKYAILSPHHLTDIVNELFMLIPILPVVGTMAWLGRNAERASGREARDARATRTPTEWFTHPAEWQFVATILVPCALYILFFHPAIGMPRDWDLFTMMTTALVPFILLVLNRYIRATGVAIESVARFAAPSLIILMVTSIAWVSVNASTERTIDRFRSILTYDRTHASYAWENLAMLQHDRKELDAAIETMRVAVDHSHNPRQSVRLAVYLDEAGRTEEAKQILTKILERRPEFSKARFRLMLFLEKENDWGQILGVAGDGVKYSPEDGIYQFFYGEALIRADRVEEGIALFRQCAKLDLPSSAMQHIAETLKAYDAQQKKN